METIALPRTVSHSKVVGKKFLMLNCTNCSVNTNQTFFIQFKIAFSQYSVVLQPYKSSFQSDLLFICNSDTSKHFIFL